MIFETKEIKEFREKLRSLSEEELIAYIDKQNPKTVTDIGWKQEILRKNWVFRNKLSHLTDVDGNPILERDYTKEDLIRLVDPPFMFSKELMKQGFSKSDQMQIHVASDPVLWCKQILGVQPRSYQAWVMRDPHDQIVLRFGRRLGKSYLLSMYMIWYAFVNANARVLVLAPAKTQVALLYDAVLEMLQKSPLISDSIERSVRNPQNEIKLTNGSTIRMFTTGSSSGKKADGARGQEADMIILDEMDYMHDDDLIALLAMLQDTDQTKLFDKKLIGASTPTGQRKKYWQWNTDPAEDFHAYYLPSYVNPGWNQDVEDTMRRQYGEQGYRHEIEADWGEDAQGVYSRKYVDAAFNKADSGWDYNKIVVNPHEYIYTLGVDWDKYGAGVNLVVCQAPIKNPANGPVRVIFRDEIKKGEFTYLESVDEIVRLDKRFDFKHIYVDQGSGEVQAELLHKYGLENPSSKMHVKVKAKHFSNVIEIRDPYTRQLEKKRLKPFMVDNLNIFLETQKIIFNNDDDELYLQLISYIKIRETEAGYPVFEAGGNTVDHAHDGLILALFAISENYDPLFEPNVMGVPRAFSNESFVAPEARETKANKTQALSDSSDRSLSKPRGASFNKGSTRAGRGNKIKRKMF